MNKYVKNPIEIEAIQFDGTKDGANAVLAWIGSFGVDANRVHKTDPEQGITIDGVHGQVEVKQGEWVIKQNDNDFYPCSDEVFQQNYKASPSTFLDRLKVEQVEVQTRLDGLTKTLNVETKPSFVSDEQWVLMSRQQFHMRMYAQIIGQRIDLAEGKPIAPAATRKTYLQGSETDLT